MTAKALYSAIMCILASVRRDRERARKCRRASADSWCMADLQRSMDRIWNIVRARRQAARENSDADASTGGISKEKFSRTESAENFIRQDLAQFGPDQYTSCWNRPFFL